MSKSASGPAHVDATPTPERSRPVLQQTDTALRAAIGRYTVDIVAGDGRLLAAVGRGVGTPPVLAEIAPAVSVALIELADRVDKRTAWRTQAWPLAC